MYCREEGTRCLFLHVDVVLHGATYVVVFTDTDQMPPPYRVDNFAEVCLDPWFSLIVCHISLCLCFNGHFPGGPGLAGTSMSPFWILLELRVMEVVVTTGAIRCAKLQSKCHHQQTNTQFLTGQMPFLLPNQQY